jgi:hypothetical protein
MRPEFANELGGLKPDPQRRIELFGGHRGVKRPRLRKRKIKQAAGDNLRGGGPIATDLLHKGLQEVKTANSGRTAYVKETV